MTAETAGRLLIHLGGKHAAGDAAWNMAVDQAISQSAGSVLHAGDPYRATLRWYRWSEPTLSLGYFQSAQDSMPRFDGLEHVRRGTGGGAILHHHELTYSLTLPSAPGEHGARDDLYRGVHAAIARELEQLGAPARPFRMNKRPLHSGTPFLCFQRRTDEDLVLQGYKILGSAQRRSKHAILQHGSLLLRSSEHADELPGIFDLTSLHLDPNSLALRLTKQIGDVLGIAFKIGGLSPSEEKCVTQISAERFSADSWWSRR